MLDSGRPLKQADAFKCSAPSEIHSPFMALAVMAATLRRRRLRRAQPRHAFFGRIIVASPMSASSIFLTRPSVACMYQNRRQSLGKSPTTVH